MTDQPEDAPTVRNINDLPEILITEEVAALLRLSKSITYNKALKGEIPSFKVGGARRYRRSDILAYINQQAGDCSAC